MCAQQKGTWGFTFDHRLAVAHVVLAYAEVAYTGTMETLRMTAWVHGTVQHVGFRWWVRSEALELGLSGSATNFPDGRVCVVVEGDRPQCVAMLGLLMENPSSTGRPGHVTSVIDQWSTARGVSGFEVR